MREFRVTLLPATALRVIRAAGMEPGGFAYRAICSGGEALGADLLAWIEEFFGATVNEGYGQTDRAQRVHRQLRFGVPDQAGVDGPALPGTTVAVLDEDGNPVIDQVGELVIDRHHPNTMLEYWRNPQGTAAKFQGDWLLTGDLCRQDAEGYIWFESRKDDMINSAGYRIGPGEIEGSLGAHEAVAMSAVVGAPDERRGQVPKAFVVLRPGTSPPTSRALTSAAGSPRTRCRAASSSLTICRGPPPARSRGEHCGAPDPSCADRDASENSGRAEGRRCRSAQSARCVASGSAWAAFWSGRSSVTVSVVSGSLRLRWLTA